MTNIKTLDKIWSKEAKRWKEGFEVELNEFPFKWFDKVKGKLLLETGCGSGNNLYGFNQLGYRTYGLDVSEEVLITAKRNCEGKNFKPLLIKSDVRKMPFKDNTFDLLLSPGLVEHLKDHKNAVHESIRILKKGGHLWISVPYKFTFFVLNKKIQQLIRIWPLGLEKSFSERYFKKLLEKNGMEIIKTHRAKAGPGKRYPVVGKTIRFLDDLLLSPFNLGGHFMYFLAKKK